jgi:hypothetical protein
VVPPCWEQDNGMGEAVFALQDHERVRYAETATPSRPVEWFRALDEIQARLVSIGTLTQCRFHEHRVGHLQDRPSAKGAGDWERPACTTNLAVPTTMNALGTRTTELSRTPSGHPH